MIGKKIYISGPITTNHNYKQQFTECKLKLEEKGYTVLTPLFLDVELNYEDYMTIDFAMIQVAEAIYMMKGWTNSDGAMREYMYAAALKKEIIEE